jgi:hypothetical protein
MNMKKILSMGLAFALAFASIIPATSVKAAETGETVINGNISPTENFDISVSATAMYAIDENGDFVYTPASVVVGSPYPIEFGWNSYSKTGSLTEVLKNDTSVLGTLTGSETDEQLRAKWATLGKNGSKNIAIYLKDSLTSEYATNYVGNEIALATLADQITANGGYYKKGVILGGDSVSFEIVAFYGLAHPEAVVMTHTLGFVFNLAD